MSIFQDILLLNNVSTLHSTCLNTTVSMFIFQDILLLNNVSTLHSTCLNTTVFVSFNVTFCDLLKRTINHPSKYFKKILVKL
ncbi:hypothetical protein M8J76_015306 [Diaphorina citri]|nr:hypothetical protein M8J75_002984 [Diaphorina citri]KAI5694164.1 hypothetical protein M8J75_011781 [Diaphorina citri]KAI5699213.1 hypothetical protein M8J76_005044 [Diaphorina citri]KAI5702189.1 hypothetical protein M8J76_015306 [Diaphorina citri]KAI5743075.1 hypothetical protein M8J77_014244 [Diaphorina citri]